MSSQKIFDIDKYDTFKKASAKAVLLNKVCRNWQEGLLSKRRSDLILARATKPLNIPKYIREKKTQEFAFA